MFNNSHFLMGFLVTKDLPDQRDRVLSAVMAAQFPRSNMLGPLLLKPAVVDKVEELEATKVNLQSSERRVQTVSTELAAARNQVATLQAKVKSDLGLRTATEIDGLDFSNADTVAKVKQALRDTVFPAPNVPPGP